MPPGLGALAALSGWRLHQVWGNGDHQSQLQHQSSVENSGVNTFRVEIHEARLGNAAWPQERSSHCKILRNAMSMSAIWVETNDSR